MSLKAVYQRFLEVPNPISLSERASLHYINTLTTFPDPAAIIRHLETQNKKVVRTKSAKVITAIEGHNALAAEVELVLEFISGGGSYLPGMENFIVDKIATIATVSLPTSSIQISSTDTTDLGRPIWCISMQIKEFHKFAFRGIRDHYSCRLK